MGEIREPQKVFALAGITFQEGFCVEAISEVLEEKLGKPLMSSPIIRFFHTTYYREEMGNGLFKQWYVFERLVVPDMLAGLKCRTNVLESIHRDAKRARRVNIDPGLLSLANLVLATTKDFSHRIYLGKGIYGEVTLMFQGRAFHPLPWTYPDYREEKVLDFFSRARKVLKNRLQGT